MKDDRFTPSPTGGQPLAQLLRQASAELHAQPLPPLPAVLLQAPAAQARPSAAGGAGGVGRWFSGPRLAFAGAVGAAMLLLGATWLLVGPVRPGTEPRGLDMTRMAAAESGFVPVVPAERWERLAGVGASPAWLMTADLPAERLAAYGLPYDPGRAADVVRAELLLNPAGEVLALRVVNPAPR